MSPTKDARPRAATPSLGPFRRVGRLLLLAGMAAAGSVALVSCSPAENAPGGGGSGGSNGSTGSGGAASAGSGGLSGSGGSGTPGTGSGGSSGTGSSSGTGTGGIAPGSGGSAASSGGSSGGVGGASGAGGRAGGTGGASTGGALGTGGRAAGGASAATGGAASTGGSSGSAGAPAGGGGAGGGAAPANPMMNFFVSSDTSTTANLGGLAGADMRCQRLAAAVGAGSKTWRAYLSAANPATNAIDRIGAGPYYNAQGAMVAADKTALHARAGDAALFLTERGGRVNGQWTGSPMPLEHDVLTGTLRDGTLATGNTCGDWTATTGNSQVGHCDGLGPNQSTSGMYSYWNSAHTGQCGNTAPGGGAGRIYCFVGP